MFHDIIRRVIVKEVIIAMLRYREVNNFYLITVLAIITAGFIPLGVLFPSYAALFFISQLITVLPSLFYLMKTKQNYVEAVGLRKVSLSNVALLVFFAFCMSSVMTFINALSKVFAKDLITDTLTNTSKENPFFISLICIAILPAIFEESIYRGIFYQEYRKVNPLGAIFLSAFLFGLLHGNLNQFTYAFIMGVVFAFVIEATDSILSTMIIHFVINGSSVVLLYAMQKFIPDYENYYLEATKKIDLTFSYVVRMYGPGALIFAVAGYFIFMRIAKNCGRWEHIKQLFKIKGKVPFQRLFTVPLVIAIVILIFLIIGNEIAI